MDRHRSRGFALLELLFVIVGVVILVVLIREGASILDRWRGVNTAEALQDINIGVYTYYLKYRALPGDDPRAAGRWDTVLPPPGPDGRVPAGNGLIDHAITGSAAQPGEEPLFWEHLRRADIIGSREDPTLEELRQPVSDGWGRPLAVYDGALGLANTVCGRLPAGDARRWDGQVDDGKAVRGLWRWIDTEKGEPPKCLTDWTPLGPGDTVWLCVAVGPHAGRKAPGC